MNPLVKELTGGDLISARFLYGEYFNFKPQFKAFIATHSKPKIRGVDLGIWRRIRLIPFNTAIPEDKVDRKLPDKLLHELPGILNWTIKGCLEWRKSGLSEPEIVLQATSAHREEMDILAEFFSERCVFDLKNTSKDPKNTLEKPFFVSSSSLYSEYLGFCEAEKTKPVPKKVFGTMIAERGYTPIREYVGGKRTRGYIGLDLKSEEEKQGEMFPVGHVGHEIQVTSHSNPP